MLQPALALALALGVVLGAAAVFNGLPDGSNVGEPSKSCGEGDACAPPAEADDPADGATLPAASGKSGGQDGDRDHDDDPDEEEERKKGKGRGRDD